MLDQVEIEVSESDIDELGHVNNARFLEYFERGRIRWYNSIGLFGDSSFGGRFGTVVVCIKINYRRECFEGDLLRLRTEPHSKGKRSYVLYQEIRNHAGDLVSDAEVTSVIMDLELRKTVDMPAELADRFPNKPRVEDPSRLKEKQ
jgi:YbgC/YbaW family acyl-CoA thioester hydrolase